MKPDKVEEFAKKLSADVRWSSGYGQYENGSKEQQAYIDGVTTAIGMMYIGLTGTPKSKGMLMEYHQDLMSDAVERGKEVAEDYADDGGLYIKYEDFIQITKSTPPIKSDSEVREEPLSNLSK